MHEYGHYINDVYDLAASDAAGSHYAQTDLIIAKEKEKGIELAWSEGLATYLATSAQKLLDDSIGINRGKGACWPNFKLKVLDEGKYFSKILSKLLSNIKSDNSIACSKYILEYSSIKLSSSSIALFKNSTFPETNLL